MSAGHAARAYLRRHHGGMLSTISIRLSGYPFGSVVPYLLDQEARPVILISKLAEHTRNIASDARVSLLVSEPAGDPQAGARLTLVGNAARLDVGAELLMERYIRYFPDSRRLLALGDFAFHRVEPRELRWIGGFGDIQWIPASDYRPPANRLAGAEPGILACMNAEHTTDLRNYCRHFHGKTAAAVQMAGIDCDGFDVRCDGELLRFEFETAATDAAAARSALAAMTQKARVA